MLVIYKIDKHQQSVLTETSFRWFTDDHLWQKIVLDDQGGGERP